MKKVKQIIIPLIILLTGIMSNTIAQTWNTAGNTLTGSEKLGSTSNQPLNFYTNNGLKMTLTTAGDLNLTLPASSLMINDDRVLWHNDNTSNIFVGVGAGLSISSANAQRNTFVGNNAGYTTNYGGTTNQASDNTFVGHEAGYQNTIGRGGTFIGEGAGRNNDDGYWNTFVGRGCGEVNIDGERNAFYGKHAGALNVHGSYNTYIGEHAAPKMGSGLTDLDDDYNVMVGNFVGELQEHGAYNTYLGAYAAPDIGIGADEDDDYNVIIGYEAGGNLTKGSSNVIVGSSTGVLPGENSGLTIIGTGAGSNNLIEDVIVNSTALGQNATITFNNQMILGDNNVNVGIGLSNDGVLAGPQNKLEINADPSSMSYTGTGGSGLRFRQLTQSSSSGTTPWGMVLTVDEDGDVVLVDDEGGGTVTVCSTGSITNTLTKWTATNEVCGSIVTENGNRVGISITSPNAKLDVQGTAAGTTPVNVGVNAVGASEGGRFSGENRGLLGTATGSGFAAFTGVEGEANGAGLVKAGIFGHSEDWGINIGTLGTVNFSALPSFNIGSTGMAWGGERYNIGVYGVSSNQIEFAPTQLNNPVMGVGVRGYAVNRPWNIGGIFEAGNACVITQLNWGIYARANGSNLVASGRCAGGFAGVFVGDVFRSGNDNFSSDFELKDSIQNITNALSVLSQLQPKAYLFKVDSFPYLNLPLGTQYGLIAQQVDSIIPELVGEFFHPQWSDTSGTLVMDSITIRTLNYNGLIPFAVAAINELSTGKVNTGETVDYNYVPKWSPTTEATLVNSNIYDDGDKVGIGTISPTAKLDVRSDVDSFGIYGLNSGSYELQVGIVGESKHATQTNIGVGGISRTGTDTTTNFGLYGIADSSEQANVGLVGFAESEVEEGINVGVGGIAGYSGMENKGGFFQVPGDSISNNYAIHAFVESGSAPNNYAGYFNGDVNITGTLYNPSDGKLKNNVQDIESALELINQLAPKDYEYKTADYATLNLPVGKQYGLIAQEVEAVMPELVSEIVNPALRDRKGKMIEAPVSYKAINYTGIIPILIGAVKEQQQTIDSLTKVIDERLTVLENGLSHCCGANARMAAPPAGEETHNVSVELSALQVVVLEQNVPNPFAEQTSIQYFIPDDAGAAQMVFVDVTGRVIKSVEVEKGYGTVTVFAQNLSQGTYSYSLIIDGKVIETKKMMKTR